MRLFISVTLLLLAFTVGAQKSEFVRVYDLSGNKIHKGKIIAVTETSLQLDGGKEPITIPVTSIGRIRTKRSPGSNVVWGAALGGVAGSIMGLATADEDELFGYSAGQGFSGGFLLGLLPGAAAGGITALFKKPVTYEISGDLNKWKSFHTRVNNVNKVNP